jgi:hypothetical protein
MNTEKRWGFIRRSRAVRGSDIGGMVGRACHNELTPFDALLTFLRRRENFLFI